MSKKEISEWKEDERKFILWFLRFQDRIEEKIAHRKAITLAKTLVDSADIELH